jgi:hypothetical protein
MSDLHIVAGAQRKAQAAAHADAWARSATPRCAATTSAKRQIMRDATLKPLIRW